MDNHQGMTIIVKTITRVILWMILLYGIYIIFHGHLTPGGGFGGGVVLALGFLSILLAHGREFIKKWLNLHFLHEAETSGILLFLLIGIIGIATGGSFLVNFLSKGTLFNLFSAGFIPILNIAIGLKVGLSLFLAVLVLAEINPEEGDEE